MEAFPLLVVEEVGMVVGTGGVGVCTSDAVAVAVEGNSIVRVGVGVLSSVAVGRRVAVGGVVVSVGYGVCDIGAVRVGVRATEGVKTAVGVTTTGGTYTIPQLWMPFAMLSHDGVLGTSW